MGIIQNQASKSTFYIYVGVLIGFVNSGILFPQFLEADKKGFLDFITSASLVMAVLFSFGIPAATVRLFPYFRDDSKQHQGYLGFILLSCIVGFIIGVVAIMLRANWYDYDLDFGLLLILLSVTLFFRLLYNLTEAYNRMLYNPVLGVIASNIVLRLVSLISISLFAASIITFNGVLIFHAVALSLPGVISFIYALYFKPSSLRVSLFLNHIKENKLTKEFRLTSIYGFMASFGAIVLLEFDRIMLFDMMGVKYAGIYATAAFFGIIVNMPSRGLVSIASVIIADSWKRNDIKNIQDVYTKSTLNLQIISGYIFIGVMVCSKHVFAFMKPEYSLGLTILPLIAIAQLFDAITSVNTDIISSSKFYRYQTYFMFAMVFILIGLNIWLIPIYGMMGAAISTMVAIVLTNLFRTIFIKWKLHLSPFTTKNIWMLFIMAATLFIAYFVDGLLNMSSIMHIFICGSIITLLYWLPVVLFKISPDISQVISNKLNRNK